MKNTKGLGWPDVVVKVVDFLWKVIDAGYVTHLLLLLLMGLVGLCFWKMPSEQIAPTLKYILNTISGKIILTIAFTSVEAITLVWWRYEVKVLKAEVKRLGDEKSYWIHKPAIKEHRSSGYAWDSDSNGKKGENL